MKKFWALVFVFACALAAFTPLMLGKGGAQQTSAAATSSEAVIKISQNGTTSSISLSTLASNVNYDDDATINGYQNYTLTLTQDITISESFTPIGTPQNPFRGSFDGNGHTITFSDDIDSESAYQGLFGYASGATIKNLQIEGALLGEPTSGNSEIYSGLLLGYGNNVTIENCEVLGTTARDITKRSTIGALAGKLVGGSLKNVSARAEMTFSPSPANSYTIKIGALLGVADNVTIEKSVVFGSLSLSAVANASQSNFYIGGMIGELERGSITDSVSGASISVTTSQNQNYVTGAIVGNILTAPQNGRISSVAYSSSLSAYGNAGSYSPANLNTNDSVINISDSSILRTESFYISNSYQVESGGQYVTFAWNQSAEPWDFASTWVVINDSGSQVRLQSFQNFSFSLENMIDDNGMLVRDGTSPMDNISYGETATFVLKFKNTVDENYYNISQIYRDGESLNFAEFVPDSNDSNTKVSPNGEISLTDTAPDAETGTTYRTFTLKILASSATEGSYSFQLEAVRFPVYLAAGEIEDGAVSPGTNGGIRYSNSTNKTSEIARELTNGAQLTIDAVPDRLFAFSSWQLYYLAPDDSTGTITYGDKKWVLNNAATLPATSSITINFGVVKNGTSLEQGIFNQTFLLLATFVRDPYVLNFSYDANLISRIEVNNKTLQSNSVELDKNETVNLKVYINAQNAFDADRLIESIRGLFASETSRVEYESYADPNNAELTVHAFTFSTSALQSNESDSYSLSLKAAEAGEAPENDNTVWIIVGVVGGVVLLAAIGLTIWLVLRKRAASRVNGRKDDYKRYFY